MSDSSSSVWLRRGAVFAILVNLLGGALVGFTMGYVPVVLQYQSYVANCTRYETMDACNTLSGRSSCQWIVNGTNDGECFFDDRLVYHTVDTKSVVDVFASTSCGAFDEDTCSSQTGCYFDARAKVCKHLAGWTPVQQGVFAAMMIVGSILGSAVAGSILARLTRMKVLFLVGCIGTLAMALQTGAWAADSYPLYVVARFVSGLAVGIGSVLCPMYCGESAPDELKNAIGVSFQVFLCFGLFIASVSGVAVSPENDVRDSSSLVNRFHWVNGVGFLLSVILFPASAMIPEPDATDKEPPLLAHETVNPGDDDAGSSSTQDESGKSQLVMALAVAFFLATNQQMTGINAICTYAPIMTASAGLAPLTGNAIVMAWNFAASCICIPLARNFSLRKVYLIGAVWVCIACFFTAAPTFPGVVKTQTTKNGLELSGILLFLLAFECGPGPMFYVLSQTVFPAKYRGVGCSFCNTAQFVWNIVINFGYPLAQQGLSGGKNANQDKGLALCFIIFGSLGVICTLFLLKFVP